MIDFFGAGTALVIINWIYAQLFGWYLEGLLQKEFDWILFLLVTVAILGFKIYALGHSTSIPLRRALHTVLRTTRKKQKAQSFSHLETGNMSSAKESGKVSDEHGGYDARWEREEFSKR